VALLRAVCTLEDRGLIDADRYATWCNWYGKTIVCRPGHSVEKGEYKVMVEKVFAQHRRELGIVE